LLDAPVAPLALPLLPSGGGRPALRRRAALGLALLALPAVGVLVATGTNGLPGAGSAAAASGRQDGAEADADFARAPARGRGALPGPEAPPPADRVVAPRHAAALFARHSWYVAPPPLPPAPPQAPPPPPPPTAPPFPYSLVGSYSPGGDPPVFFLARGDRVIDARVGDRLDGVYQFESAAGGQLVFVYLPLNIRQNLPAGGAK
jgi:hypothetical protein